MVFPRCVGAIRMPTSNYRGVYFHAGKWRANAGHVYLGRFHSEIEAARHYDAYMFLRDGERAKTNGTVTYEAVKGMDIRGFMAGEKLPKNIYRHKKVFMAKVLYKGKYISRLANTLEEAEARLAEINQIVKEDEEMTKAIVRNAAGEAVVPVFNINREVVGEARVPDDLWHRCMRFRWYRKAPGCGIVGYVEGKHRMLSRVVCGVDTDMVVRFRDGDAFNCLRENLEVRAK